MQNRKNDAKPPVFVNMKLGYFRTINGMISGEWNNIVGNGITIYDQL